MKRVAQWTELGPQPWSHSMRRASHLALHQSKQCIKKLGLSIRSDLMSANDSERSMGCFEPLHHPAVATGQHLIEQMRCNLHCSARHTVKCLKRQWQAVADGTQKHMTDLTPSFRHVGFAACLREALSSGFMYLFTFLSHRGRAQMHNSDKTASILRFTWSRKYYCAPKVRGNEGVSSLDRHICGSQEPLCMLPIPMPCLKQWDDACQM